jgi:hypothetical protein
MTEGRKTYEFAPISYGGGGSGKCALGNAGAKNVESALETGGLCGEISWYQAVSNLVQTCP